MAERRENSVLFSLNELRNIESDRVRSEEEAERQRIEGERRAREDEVRRTREAEENRRRAAEDKVRHEYEAKERVAREAEMRLKEVERRAQIEAATKLEQARIEAEARARVRGGFPTSLVVISVILLVGAAGGTMWYLVYNHNLELARTQAELTRRADQERKELLAQQAAQQAKLQKELADLQGQLDKASNEVERAQIKAKMASASTPAARPASARVHHEPVAARTIEADSSTAALEPTTPPKTKKGKGKDKEKSPTISDTNDPLGGLGL